ncbi:hypothetical protein EC988_005010 [Linderina pennispora]|nr:hypothetical protein EC988_005010 [Linderina pennispora]
MADGTDRAMRVLCQAPRIKRVDISGSNVSDEALLELVRARGHSLHELTLSDCARLTRHSIGNLTPTMLPSLVSLDLYNVMVTTDTYQHLFNMHTYWPYLQDLKLKAAIPHISPRQDSLVNDDILEAIGSRCPMLVSLRLFGCHGITDEGLSSVLGNLGYLRELVVMHSATDPLVQNNGEDEESDSDSDATFHSARSSRRSSARFEYSATEESDDLLAGANDSGHAGPSTGGLLMSVPSINDIWATIPSLPTHGLQQPPANLVARRVDSSPQSTAPNSPCLTRSRNQRVFTSQALSRGVRSRRFNLLNLDMEYDSVCAEHLSRLSHLHVLCGRVITRHAKALIETQFPKCKMMVWNIN